MSEHNKGNLNSKILAEKKNKRLEQALSAFSDEQAKESVNKLIEKFIDDGEESYFNAGYVDKTLYFADDDYIEAIENEKKKNKKKSITNKFQKFVSKKSDKNDIFKNSDSSQSSNDASKNNLDETMVFKPINDESNLTNKNFKRDFDETKLDLELEKTTVITPVDENILNKSTNDDKLENKDNTEILETNKTSNDKLEEVNENMRRETFETVDKTKENQSEFQNTNENNFKSDETKIFKKEPVLPSDEIASDVEKTDNETETSSKEVNNEFVESNNNFEMENELENTDLNDEKVNEDEYNEDFSNEDEEKEEKNKKFGNFFKRKNLNDPFEDDDDEYDEFDDEDYDDEYDDYYHEGPSKLSKVLNALLIIVLLGSTAFFAASNYLNVKKLESVNSQVNNTTNNDDQLVEQLQEQVSKLQAENATLKNNQTQNTEPTSSSNTNSNSETNTNTNTSTQSTYTIQPNDTGSKICIAVYGKYTEELWQGILKANNMTSSTVYHPGDVLQIP